MVLEASRTVDVDAPIERCYELAADIEGAPDWQETLLDVEVLERDDQGRPLVVETVSDAVVRKARTRLRFSYDPPKGLSWEQLEGDPKWLNGRWAFEDLGDGRTRATYALESDPGRLLGMLLRGPVQDRVKDHVTRAPTEGLQRVARG
ncbi:MAG TPA: SRPBCC family protein [Thermoleophilaceae bacterium]|nr:SRPBCC family protein [Thermoleophilaceae bacterium]